MKSEARLGKSTRPYLKKKKKVDWGVAKVVEFLLSNCKALSLFPSTAKRRGRRRKRRRREEKMMINYNYCFCCNYC